MEKILKINIMEKILKIKNRGVEVSIPLPDRFFVFIHGVKHHIWVDAVTPSGVAYQDWGFYPNKTKMKRKYVACNTFYTLFKHRVV